MKKPNIQIDNIVREMTDDEYAELLARGWTEEVQEVVFPLAGMALVSALNAALGIWTLEDASNISGVPEQALIDEVLAWAVAKSINS